MLYGFMFDPKSVLERKNVKGLVDAFRAAVRPGDNAALVLKSSDRVGYSFDYEMVKAEADGETVIFIEQSLDRASTYAFIKSLDAYISLHRSEGFGLTCAEAMAAGIPTIATGYSGNLEFMTAQNSLLVPASTDPDRAARSAPIRAAPCGAIPTRRPRSRRSASCSTPTPAPRSAPPARPACARPWR